MVGMRGFIWVWAMVVAGSSAASSPLYKVTTLSTFGQFNYEIPGIYSFSPSGRITAALPSGLFKPPHVYLYDSAKVVDLDTYPGFQRSGTIYTNDRKQFTQSSENSQAKFKSNLDGPWEFLHPIGDYADAVYAKGMTENFVFGAQTRAGHDSFAEPLTYNTLTGQYQIIDMLPYGFNGGEIQDMNERGDTLITASIKLFDQIYRFSDHAFIFRNGTMVHDLGHMRKDYSFLNSKGHVVGSVDNPEALGKFKYWDGNTINQISIYGLGTSFTPSGLSDDGTILVIDRSKEFVVNALYKSGQYYNFKDVCLGLPVGMTIHSAKIRPDGAIAGVGILNDETYLMRLDPVPEPASLVAHAAGLCAMVSRRRLRPGS